jgi:uncharacterized membrane protein YccC
MFSRSYRRDHKYAPAIKLIAIRTFLWRWRPQLVYSARSTIAAVTALVLAQTLKLPLALWAVLTALIVTQMNVSRSIKTTINYFIGTISGAVYGGAVGILVPHVSEIAVLGTLALILGPLLVIAATNSSFAVAPITGVLVLLIPDLIHSTPLLATFDRLLEVALGGATGLVVSLVLPSTAHRTFAKAAANILNQMAQALEVLLSRLQRRLDEGELNRLQDALLRAISQLSTASGEAEDERMVRFAGATLTAPLLRAIMRLRYDIVTIGRAVSEPLSPDVETRLEAPLAKVRTEFAAYMRACGVAVFEFRSAPPLDPVQSALGSYAAEVAAVRGEGLVAKLSGDATERFFALGFILDQMHHDSQDLGRLVNEWSAAIDATASKMGALEGSSNGAGLRRV